MVFTKRIVIILICAFAVLSGAAMAESPAYGESVTVDGGRITIDRGFLKELAKSPTGDEWSKNYWELLYFIERGEHQAISVGIDLLLNIKEHRSSYDDHFGVKNLAIALTMTNEFHSVVCEKSKTTVSELNEYYKKYRGDYASTYDAPWTTEWCQ